MYKLSVISTNIEQIFQNADEVIIWLGEDGEMDVQTMLHFLQHKQNQIQSGLREHSRQREKDFNSSFRRMLSKPFFSRLWIVQEVVVAAEIEVICVHHRIGWADLLAVSSLWLSTDHAPSAPMEQFSYLYGEDETDLRRVLLNRGRFSTIGLCWSEHKREGSKLGHDAYSLHKYLGSFKGTACSQVHEHVFALLGLSKEADTSGHRLWTIWVGYDRSVSDLWRTTLLTAAATHRHIPSHFEYDCPGSINGGPDRSIAAEGACTICHIVGVHQQSWFSESKSSARSTDTVYDLCRCVHI
jgi:hypothetical protein